MVDKICKNCGLLKKHKGLGLCRNCYDKQRKRPMKICKNCNKLKEHHGRGMCGTCCRELTTKTIICKNCGKQGKERRKGYCNACSSKIWREETNYKYNISEITDDQRSKYNKNRRIKYNLNKENEREKNRLRRKKNGVKWNKNRGLKRNPNYSPRKDKSNFVCKCGSTEYNCNNMCKKCYRQTYGQKNKKALNEYKKKYNRLKTKSQIRYSKKIQKVLGLTNNQIVVKYRPIRNQQLIDDNFKCQICGKTEKTQVHHMFYVANYPKLMFNKNNLITLCTDVCHNIVHWKKIDTSQYGFIEKNVKFPKYITLK